MATDKRAPAGFAPLAIGLTLTLIHPISIPVTNTSVNPARSTGVAIFQGTGAAAAVVFWLVPLVGGIIGGLIYRCLLEDKNKRIAVDSFTGSLHRLPCCFQPFITSNIMISLVKEPSG